MPHIVSFLWYPRSDAERVNGMVEALRAIADAHDVSFYVEEKEHEKAPHVVVHQKVDDVPADVVSQLDLLAQAAGVTIYLNPG